MLLFSFYSIIFHNFFQYCHQPFYSIQFLSHLKEFFGVMFKIQAKQSVDDNSVAGGESKILLSYVGAEYTRLWCSKQTAEGSGILRP